MNRRRTLAVIVAALALPLALAAAAEAAPAWRARLEAFERTGESERKKLGLDRDDAREQLYARYPTPEVTFGAAPWVCPGATVPVKLAGEVPQGALVFARGDSVEIVGGKRTAGGWEGAVRASPTAPPGSVDLVVMTPVSLAQASPGDVTVGCKHTFTLDAGGDALVLRTEFAPGANGTASGEWRRGAKVLGTMAYRADAGASSLDLAQDQTPEEAQAQVGGFQRAMASKAWKDLDARTEVQMKAIQGCAKLAPERMAACFAAPQKELEKIDVERQALVAQAEREGAPAFGCRALHLSIREGKVEGDAEGCAGKRAQERVKVAGRYTAP